MPDDESKLPGILPVFPLTGVLLLPGSLLPLHVFEPRYRHLVRDALAADGVFGMIQPFAPRHDNRPRPGAERETPALYSVGCAGRIEGHEQLPDGRFLMSLRGISRFRVIEELPLHERGYRRVRADYAPFAQDRHLSGWAGDRAALIEALGIYCRANGMVLEVHSTDGLADAELIHAIAVTLPFHAAEKQALLESDTMDSRQRDLLELLRMGGGSAPEDPPEGAVN